MSRQVELPAERQIDNLWSEVNEQQRKSRKADDYRLESLSDVRDVIDEADHRRHEKHADRREEWILTNVAEQFLNPDHEAHRDREREEGGDPAQLRNRLFRLFVDISSDHSARLHLPHQGRHRQKDK